MYHILGIPVELFFKSKLTLIEKRYCTLVFNGQWYIAIKTKAGWLIICIKRLNDQHVYLINSEQKIRYYYGLGTPVLGSSKNVGHTNLQLTGWATVRILQKSEFLRICWGSDPCEFFVWISTKIPFIICRKFLFGEQQSKFCQKV